MELNKWRPGVDSRSRNWAEDNRDPLGHSAASHQMDYALWDLSLHLDVPRSNTQFMVTPISFTKPVVPLNVKLGLPPGGGLIPFPAKKEA